MKNNFETIRKARLAIRRERAERRQRVAVSTLRIVARAGVTRATDLSKGDSR